MEILWDEEGSDRKCVNHARVHANAQSFDRCERKRLDYRPLFRKAAGSIANKPDWSDQQKIKPKNG